MRFKFSSTMMDPLSSCVTDIMQCVILAGGLGVRLAPLTKTVPKALVPVAGRTFADWQLSWLASEGVTRVLYCVGHLGEQIEAQIAGGGAWGLEVNYSREGGRLLGTAGALRLALDADMLEDNFFVLYGDSYLCVKLIDVHRAFRASAVPSLMTVFRNEGQWGTSNVIFRDGQVVSYCKNPGRPSREMHWIDYGICMVERDMIRRKVPPGQVYDLAQVFAEEAAQCRVAGYEVHERFYEIGSPAGLAELERTLLGRGRAQRTWPLSPP